MKTEISNEKENPYLKRKELSIIIDHADAPTPSTAALQQLLAKELNSQPEKVDVRNIYTNRGRQVSKAKVFVWEEAKVADLSKPAEGEKKEGEAAPAESAAPAPAEAKPTEAKAKPEEKPAEEKPKEDAGGEEKKE